MSEVIAIQVFLLLLYDLQVLWEDEVLKYEVYFTTVSKYNMLHIHPYIPASLVRIQQYMTCLTNTSSVHKRNKFRVSVSAGSFQSRCFLLFTCGGRLSANKPEEEHDQTRDSRLPPKLKLSPRCSRHQPLYRKQYIQHCANLPTHSTAAAATTATMSILNYGQSGSFTHHTHTTPPPPK